VTRQVETRKNGYNGVISCTAQFRTHSPKEPRLKMSIDRRRGSYARSDRQSANCLSPQPRASSDANAHVGV
jgi:hypothetical protein